MTGPHRAALFGKVTASDATRAEVVAAVERFFVTVQDEDAAEVYVVHVDDDDPNVLWFYELYRDRAGLEAHGRTPAMAELRDTLSGLVAEPPSVTLATPILAKGV